MSHSANTVSKYRLHPILRSEILPEWEIYVGMVGFLYVVGPGPKAMQRVARERTLESHAIAVKAVRLLNRTKREDTEAGPAEIIEALKMCGWKEEL